MAFNLRRGEARSESCGAPQSRGVDCVYVLHRLRRYIFFHSKKNSVSTYRRQILHAALQYTVFCCLSVLQIITRTVITDGVPSAYMNIIYNCCIVMSNTWKYTIVIQNQPTVEYVSGWFEHAHILLELLYELASSAVVRVPYVPVGEAALLGEATAWTAWTACRSGQDSIQQCPYPGTTPPDGQQEEWYLEFAAVVQFFQP